MPYQEFDQVKHERSVSFRKKLLHGIDGRLRLTGQGSYLDVMAERPLEPYVELSPSSESLPTAKLVKFTNRIYEGASVRIARVGAGFSFIDIHVENEREEAGIFKAGSDLVIPIQQREIALSPTVYIFPNEFPMTYGVQQFTMREWVRTGMIPFGYRFDKKEIDLDDLDMVEEILDPIISVRGKFGLPSRQESMPSHLTAFWSGSSVALRSPFSEELYLVGDKVEPTPQS